MFKRSWSASPSKPLQLSLKFVSKAMLKEVLKSYRDFLSMVRPSFETLPRFSQHVQNQFWAFIETFVPFQNSILNFGTDFLNMCKPCFESLLRISRYFRTQFWNHVETVLACREPVWNASWDFLAKFYNLSRISRHVKNLLWTMSRLSHIVKKQCLAS